MLSLLSSSPPPALPQGFPPSPEGSGGVGSTESSITFLYINFKHVETKTEDSCFTVTSVQFSHSIVSSSL